MKYLFLIIIFFVFFACKKERSFTFETLAKLADGWQGEIIAEVDQSYVGWDVEIGTAGSDGGWRRLGHRVPLLGHRQPSAGTHGGFASLREGPPSDGALGW